MTVLPPDPYRILGVSKDAQIPEIRSAHRKLVLRCHPDKVQDPTLKAEKQIEFQQVQQAYELLSDDKERQRYDDQAKLAELKRKMAAAKANTSAPRTTPYTKVEIRTAEPRPSTFKSAAESPPKTYTYRTRSFEEGPRSPHIFDVKREPSFEKPSKRERELEREREIRDRERERELREREMQKERDRERKRKEKEESLRRVLEKEAKEARRAEKRQREKERDKEKKRETEEKKRHAKPYIETPYDPDEVPVPSGSSKKKSSKKHEEKREPSSHREEPAAAAPPPIPQDESFKLDQARSYIHNTRSKPASGIRAKHMQQPPAAPTPPPTSSPFAAPDDDVRRSSAKARRGSSGSKSFRKSSKEVLDDEDYVTASPSARHAAREATGSLSGSPPRRELPRQNTMPPIPTGDGYMRPVPGLSRSYSDMDPPRGRDRSKMQSQVYPPIESDDEYDYGGHDRDYERRHRKHRSSKKNRSPSRSANVKQYRVDESGRTTLSSSYVRNFDGRDAPEYSSYYQTPGGAHVVEQQRPPLYREPSYTRSGAYPTYGKVKLSKTYEPEDVSYSHYPTSYEQQAAY